MGKITVKHYLNTNLKPYIVGDSKYYKIYFLFRYQNNNTKIRSLVSDDEYTEDEFNSIIADTSNLINKRIANEVRLIERLVDIINDNNIAFDMKVFNDFWKIATYPIIKKFEIKIDWFENVRYGKDVDIYQKTNIETYRDIILLLKRIVASDSNFISDEIYLAQIFDSDFNVILNNALKGKKTKTIYSIVRSDEPRELGSIIRTEYTSHKKSIIDILIDNLVDEHFHFPDIKDKYGERNFNYENLIITSISKR